MGSGWFNSEEDSLSQIEAMCCNKNKQQHRTEHGRRAVESNATPLFVPRTKTKTQSAAMHLLIFGTTTSE